MTRPQILDLGVKVDEDVLAALGNRALYIGTNGYVYFSTNRTGPQTLHSFVMGGSLRGRHIDHINGDKRDNRRENLRFVTHQANQVNRKAPNKNNTSGIRGVQLTNASRVRPWRAQITANRKTIHLGLFATCEEAVAARRAAEIEYYGVECP